MLFFSFSFISIKEVHSSRLQDALQMLIFFLIVPIRIIRSLITKFNSTKRMSYLYLIFKFLIQLETKLLLKINFKFLNCNDFGYSELLVTKFEIAKCKNLLLFQLCKSNLLLRY